MKIGGVIVLRRDSWRERLRSVHTALGAKVLTLECHTDYDSSCCLDPLLPFILTTLFHEQINKILHF
jgi:hypothetical protein